MKPPEEYKWLDDALAAFCDRVMWQEFDCGNQLGVAVQWGANTDPNRVRTAITVEVENIGKSINAAIARGEISREQVIESFRKKQPRADAEEIING